MASAVLRGFRSVSLVIVVTVAAWVIAACGSSEAGTSAARTVASATSTAAEPTAANEPENESAPSPPTPTPTMAPAAAAPDATDTSMSEEEIEESQRASASIDLSLEVALARTDETSVMATVVMQALNRSLVNVPMVLVELPAGVQAEPAGPCEPTDDPAVVSCQIARYFEGTGWPITSEPFEINFQTTPQATGQTIVFSAVSQQNPVENDPDPSNNVVEIDVP